MWIRIIYKEISLIILHLLSFFFNDTATTEIYTLSLHDALPIYILVNNAGTTRDNLLFRVKEEDWSTVLDTNLKGARSEEHTSELQSRLHLVCRLLLEKKKSGQRLCLGKHID